MNELLKEVEIGGELVQKSVESLRAARLWQPSVEIARVVGLGQPMAEIIQAATQGEEYREFLRRLTEPSAKMLSVWSGKLFSDAAGSFMEDYVARNRAIAYQAMTGEERLQAIGLAQLDMGASYKALEKATQGTKGVLGELAASAELNRALLTIPVNVGLPAVTPTAFHGAGGANVGDYARQPDLVNRGERPLRKGTRMAEVRFTGGKVSQFGELLNLCFGFEISPDDCFVTQVGGGKVWHISRYGKRPGPDDGPNKLARARLSAVEVGSIKVYDLPIVLVEFYLADGESEGVIAPLVDCITARLRKSGFRIEGDRERDSAEGGRDAGASPGTTVSEKPGLDRLEQGIVDAIKRMREKGQKIINGTIAAELMRAGIYNERTGEAYSDVHISRTKGALKEKGFNLD